MTPDQRSDRLADLFEKAAHLPRARREAFIFDASGGDAELRSELLSLLEAHDSAGPWFDDLAESVVEPALAALGTESEGGASLELPSSLLARLSQTYRIERELPGAGMSRVLLAEDLALRRPVVIKVLPPGMVPAASPERFRREIHLAAQLQHPHIVPLLTAETTDGASYYTMPFVAEESLRERLAREGSLPVEEAVRVWRDVLDALAHAHSKGVIHRDIKPGNILLSARNAIVTDFGIAQAIETLMDDPAVTGPDVTLGTPAYLAPELASGRRDADTRVDVYQAGLVMYEMLAGRLPFGGSAQAAMRAKLTLDPPPLVRADVPEALRALVMRCVARLPADRPPTAESVLVELEAALHEDSAGVGRRAETSRYRRRPALAAGAALALIVLVGAWRWVALRPAPSSGPVGAAAPPAIAVLPLVDLGSPQIAGLAEGMTEELVSVLGQTLGLRVVGSTSVAALQERGLSMRQVADSLGISHVLEGSVQRRDERMRIQMRLVDTRDGSTSWSETYDRERAAAFDVQADIARGVSRELALRLRPGAEQLAEARAGVAVDPYSHSAIRELALALATNGRCQESLEPLRQLKELTPPAAVAGILRGQCFASLGMWPEAIDEFAWAHDRGTSFGLPFLGFALARSGRRDDGSAILADLLAGRADSHGDFRVATVQAGLEDYDAAFASLHRAIDRDAVNQYLFHPMFADLHRDPRFEAVRARLRQPTANTWGP